VPNIPAHSEHLSIIFDINICDYFQSFYSDVHTVSPRMLAANNTRSISTYTKYVTDQILHHNIPKKLDQLIASRTPVTGSLSPHDAQLLNSIDKKITQILLAGERQCARKISQRQPWSPVQREIARTYSYWKQKMGMARQK
jgi:hypothetical protein